MILGVGLEYIKMTDIRILRLCVVPERKKNVKENDFLIFGCL